MWSWDDVKDAHTLLDIYADLERAQEGSGG